MRSVAAAFAAFAAAVAAVAAPANAQGLADLPLPRHGRAVLFASTDPTGGNEDHTHCLRREPDGTCVLAEADGPGRIVRIWSANPAGELRIMVDGGLAFAGPFAALFDGSRPPFVAPLSGTFAGGSLCHVPIAFERRLRVTASAVPGRYHQITVLLDATAGANGPAATTAAAGPVGPAGPAPAHELAALAAGARDGGDWLRVPGVPLPRDGTAARIAALPGAGEVLELRARTRGVEARDVWLHVCCDGEPLPCLAAPLDLLLPGDLATQASGTSDGWPAFRLPMPFRDGLAVRATIAPSPAPGGQANAQLDVLLRWRTLPRDHGRRVLHGAVHRGVNVHGTPARLADVAGSGHLAGVIARLQGAPAQHLSFLEGDERILADGRPWQGTGTEDAFSGAWYFRGAPQGSAFAAVGATDERRALVRCARFFVADPVPFERSLRVELEHGGGDDTPGSVYSTLTLWYADAATGRDPMPVPPPPEPAPQFGILRASDVWPRLAPGGGAVTWPDATPPEPPPDEAWTFWLRGARVDSAARPLRFDVVRAEPVLPALRQWRVLGPFACAERQGLDTVPLPDDDQLAHAGVAAVAGPAGFVDLWPLLRRECAVAFAVTEFDVAAGGDAVLVLGSDDAVRAFVDGTIVHEHRGVRGVGRDQDRVPLHLAAGRHRLVLQVENYRGGFGCCARVEGVPVR